MTLGNIFSLAFCRKRLQTLSTNAHDRWVVEQSNQTKSAKEKLLNIENKQIVFFFFFQKIKHRQLIFFRWSSVIVFLLFLSGMPCRVWSPPKKKKWQANSYRASKEFHYFGISPPTQIQTNRSQYERERERESETKYIVSKQHTVL